jgi:hypothetical protein
MNRLEKFATLENHAWYGKQYKSLPNKWVLLCKSVIEQNQDLDKNEFATMINRWLMSKELSTKKPSVRKKYLICQELIACSNSI